MAPLDAAQITLDRIRDRLESRVPRVRPCPAGFREAAVLILLREDPDGVEVLLCQRSEDRRDAHSGQVSLPGGQRDPGDADALATALRESWEEVGLEPDRIRLLGRLDDTLTITNFHVVPWVASIDSFDGLRPMTDEIVEVFPFPIDRLRDEALVRRVPWERDGETLEVLFVEWNGHVLWGVTARMLDRLVEVVS
jgi:8-oxo-dGTP pyrophosphatase MutT (NUDIX family)